ncbi:MAG: HEPN domain-containing protein [Opitutales bacterium]|nr:HEPN domain-containing protein [Opitutales bacterium]
MQLDPKWLVFADNDLQTAEILLREEIWNQVCFHSQQAVEKYLKASLAPKSRPRSHKVTDLLTRIPVDLDETLKKDLRRLDRFYIPTRYPDALPGSIEEGMPTKEDAESALCTAKALRSVLQKFL